MNQIAKPNKIEFKKGENSNQSIVAIEPLYPGYGMTIGNSLRRILLSSLVGAAVVGVKIKGVNHEFSTIPHIKEDVLEIIMNLKKLKLRMFAEEEIKLELDVHGKKQVKASDIKKNSQAEIINPDLVIADITDMAGSLSMEITVSKGRGYRPVEAVEDKDKKNEVGYIEMDAVFSPVLIVGLKVKNIRVGKMTNWDKIILNITTDGTISPKDAFVDSVKILIDQFKSLVVKTAEPVEKEIEAAEEKKEKKKKEEKGKKEISKKSKTKEGTKKKTKKITEKKESKK